MGERITRLCLALSAAVAVAFQSYLGARAWPHLLSLNAALFVIAFATTRWHARVALWLVLLPAYVFPAVVLVTMHGFDDALWSVWTSLLVGYVAARAPGARWAMPDRWRWPLGLWGLSVAVTWPMIVWREADFTAAQLDRYSTGVTNIGIPPAVEALWIANVAATHLIGILWIDSLYRDAQEESMRGTRAVPRCVAPLLVSASLCAAVGLYQMFGHITALNDTIFGVFHRASGAMVDANAFGMIAALWVAGAVAVATSAVSTPTRVAAAIAAIVLAVGVWSSGSQSALFAAVAGGLGMLIGVWRVPATAMRRARWTAIVVAVLAMVGLFVVSRPSSDAIGPIARLELRWEEATRAGRAGLVKVLWVRDGYGTAADAMIRRFPLTGVGVGMFNSFVVDESPLIGLGPQAPDNAQSWPRHQLAEMGILGSLGWMAWIYFYFPFLWRRPAAQASPIGTYALRGALVGLGLASLIAMPTQNGAALVTFWTFVFWHAGQTQAPRSPAAAAGTRTRWPIATAIIVAAYAVLVWRVGTHEMRVPVRAATLGWPYDHGVYEMEKPVQGPSYRWTTEQAVVTTVIPPAGQAQGAERYLPISFWAHHPDLATRPLHVKVWLRGRLAVDEMLSDSRPVTRYLRLAPDERGVMIETWVDRTWRPADAGEPDRRTLGIALAVDPPVCCVPASGSIVN